MYVVVVDFEAGCNLHIKIWEEERQPGYCACNVSKFPCDGFDILQVKDFVMTTKVPPEEAQCVGNKFWWHFNIHASRVDDLA